MVMDKPDEPLSEMDLTLIGPPRIITIPLSDRYLIREAGDMLCALGHAMKLHSYRQELSVREIASIVRAEINGVNQRIHAHATTRGIQMPRRGRKPKGESVNESETSEIVSLANPLNMYRRNYRK